MAISSKKLLGSKGGGSLAVRPKTNLVPLKKQSSSLAKVGGKQEDPMLVIKTKVIKIEDLLKGTLAAEKKAADEKRKQQEQEDRAKQEDEVEAPKTKGKGIKLPIPGKIKSFWGNIKKFIGTVLFGWLALQLLPLIPKLMPILKMLAATADFIINWGGKILSGLVTFVDWGYKAVEGTRKFIENKFGEDAAEKFDSFMGTINKVLNLVVALGMGAAAMGRGKKPPKGPKGTKQPKRSIKNKLKRTKKLMKRPFDPKRADKLKRVKNIKKIRADKLARTKKIGRLRKIAKAKKFVGKTTKAVSKTSQAVGKNVSKATKVVGKNVSKATKAVSKTSQAVGKNVSKVSGKVSQSAGKIVSRLGMKMNKGMVQSMKGLSKMAKGVKIPIIGPILAAITSYLADGKLDKALFIGIGTALGEMLGSAIPIPVLGTLIGGAIGFYIGDLLYTLFRGGGVKEVVNKLKEDLKKVFNVGKAIFNWSKTGLGRLWEGLPKVLGVPNPAWLFNPLNMVGKAKLIGKAFFSRDPMKEEKDKKDKEKKKTTKMQERNKEGYYSMLSSGKKDKIEQALYELRINSIKTGEAHSDMVGNPKYAGDVDLIMKHGMQKVEINNGRVTLQGNAENIIPLDVNSVAKKTNNISSYDEEEETVIIKPGSETGGDVAPETQTKESLAPVVVSGGGGSREIDEALYKSG